MSWNYRVTVERVGADEHPVYQIREVYYSKKGKIRGWTVDPMDPYGETLDELKDNLEQMFLALSRPPVDIDAEERRLPRRGAK